MLLAEPEHSLLSVKKRPFRHVRKESGVFVSFKTVLDRPNSRGRPPVEVGVFGVFQISSSTSCDGFKVACSQRNTCLLCSLVNGEYYGPILIGCLAK